MAARRRLVAGLVVAHVIGRIAAPDDVGACVKRTSSGGGERTTFSRGSRLANDIAFLRAALIVAAAELTIRCAIDGRGACAVHARLRTAFGSRRACGSVRFAGLLADETLAIHRAAIGILETPLTVGGASASLRTLAIGAFLAAALAVEETSPAIGSAGLSANAVVAALRAAFGVTAASSAIRGAHRCGLAREIHAIARAAIEIHSASCTIALTTQGSAYAAITLLIATLRRIRALFSVGGARRAAANTVVALLPAAIRGIRTRQTIGQTHRVRPASPVVALLAATFRGCFTRKTIDETRRPATVVHAPGIRTTLAHAAGFGSTLARTAVPGRTCGAGPRVRSAKVDVVTTASTKRHGEKENTSGCGSDKPIRTCPFIHACFSKEAK